MALKESAVGFLLWLLSLSRQPAIVPAVLIKIREMFMPDDVRYLQFLNNQSAKPAWINRFLAAHELMQVLDVDADIVLKLLKTLSADEFEIVREGAAVSWSGILEHDFDRYFSVIQNMVRSDDKNVRYTSALAPVRYYDKGADAGQKSAIWAFWNLFESDKQKSLRNVVKQLIIDKHTPPQP